MAQQELSRVPNAPLIPADARLDSIWKQWLGQVLVRVYESGQIDHGALFNLQGGSTDQYYHLTSSQHATVTSFGSFTNNRVVISDGSSTVTVHGGLAYTASTGQLSISTQSSTAGLLIGGDAQLYRSAADTLRTPDALTVDGQLTASNRINVPLIQVTGTPPSSPSNGWYLAAANRIDMYVSSVLRWTYEGVSDSVTYADNGSLLLQRGNNFFQFTPLNTGQGSVPLLDWNNGQTNGKRFIMLVSVTGLETVDVNGDADCIWRTNAGTHRMRLTSTSILRLPGDLEVHGGDMSCSTTSFRLLNGSVSTMLFGGAVTSMSIGATSTVAIGIGVPSSSTVHMALPAATTSTAPIRVPHGVAPSGPVNGDIWTTSSGVFARILGTTYSFNLTAA